MDKTEFQEIAQIRLQEAKALCKNSNYDGAYYLAGYAVECALKACIAKRTKSEEFPPSPEIVRNYYTHDLNKLVGQAEIKQDLDSRMQKDKSFAQSWNIVKHWSEQSRYERHTKVRAEEFIDAIEHQSHGVLPWLQKFW